MSDSNGAPGCDSRKLWRIGPFRSYEGDRVKSLAVACTDWPGPMGQFDAYVCAECGYTEWHARGLERLEPDPKNGIHRIDTTPQQGHYR